MSTDQPGRDIRSVGLWAVTVVLAMIFVGVGVTKLAATDLFEAHFARWGLPLWLIWLSGAIEATGGLVVLVPSMATVGAGLLALSAAGAVVIHVTHGELLPSLFPALLATTASVVAYLRRAPLLAASPSRLARSH
ncbi:MAG: DoxX family protein [Deltaproteobacteria bacterium]|nr:DoxX family protein [Deltaproteobacteria bacterium]